MCLGMWGSMGPLQTGQTWALGEAGRLGWTSRTHIPTAGSVSGSEVEDTAPRLSTSQGNGCYTLKTRDTHLSQGTRWLLQVLLARKSGVCFAFHLTQQ
jgi:hypothetical protein